MNKQELIDRAVKQFGGKFPDVSGTTLFTLRYEPSMLGIAHYPFLVHYNPLAANHVCTIKEFERRASELGWINGYKYGVEYEVNGKNPDLPEGTLLEVTYVCGTKTKEKLNKTTFDFRPMYDPRPVSFRIVDERYKPVEGATSSEVEQADWYDYGKQQAIALPPVGDMIEFRKGTTLDYIWLKGDVKYISKFVTVIKENTDGIDISLNTALGLFRPLDYNREVIRKADEEKRRFVDTLTGKNVGGYIITRLAAEEIYDLCFRFIEVKND